MKHPNKSDNEITQEVGQIGPSIHHGDEPEFESCCVTEHDDGVLTITFDNSTYFFLETYYDKLTFAYNCGKVRAQGWWDGVPSKLVGNWWEIEWNKITSCPSYYRKLFAE